MKAFLLPVLLCTSAAAFAQDYHPATNATPDNHQLFVDEMQRNQAADEVERTRTEQYRVDAEREPGPAFVPFNKSGQVIKPALPHFFTSVVALSGLHNLGHKPVKAVHKYLTRRGWSALPAGDSVEGRLLRYAHGATNTLMIGLDGAGKVTGIQYSGSDTGFYQEAVAAIESHAEISEPGSDYYKFQTKIASIYFARQHRKGQNYWLSIIFNPALR